MRVPRVYVDAGLAAGTSVELSADTAHRLLRVLRLTDGAPVRLFDGSPGDWHARLRVAGKRRARADVERFEPRPVEPALSITLVQGISRGPRMDYTLEKSVELGVTRVVPVVTDRSQAVPAGERIDRKARHWRGVLEAAAAQSGRTRVPVLEPQRGFGEWLARADPGDACHVLLDPAAERGPGGLEPRAALALLAGPEGGFSDAERRLALDAGCQPMRLGPRILRTETAAVAALAAIQAIHGDLG